ncbi:hypothetical protein OK016_18265 [Vibrio chagasii]|nr:hypothetical protein [Vibrio chagasii]
MEQAFSVWCEQPSKTYVYTENDVVLGSYYISPMQWVKRSYLQLWLHGFEEARGGNQRSLFVQASQQVAIELGFEAMQFNSVIVTSRQNGNQALGKRFEAYLSDRFLRPISIRN